MDPHTERLETDYLGSEHPTHTLHGTPDTSRDDSTALTAGRHPVDVGQLVMGIAFLGLVVVWALIHYAGVGADDFRFLLPLPWVVGGGVGLLVLATRSRTRTTQHPTEG